MDGNLFLRVLRRVLIPAATLVAESKKISNDREKDPCVCRPSDLPIYEPEPRISVSIIEEEEEASPLFIENTFSTIRKSMQQLYHEAEAYKRVSLQYVEETKENAHWLLDYLRKEDNTAPKAGAIGIGALAGWILGLRGGIFRRTLFATAGALGMAAVCYPREAAEYSDIGITEAKKYVKIAYNFAYGGEEDIEIEEKKVIVGTPVKKKRKGEGDEDDEEDEEDEESTIDPLAIVTEAHDQASQSCHCPIGSCLGQHDESAQSEDDMVIVTEEDVQNTTK